MYQKMGTMLPKNKLRQTLEPRKCNEFLRKVTDNAPHRQKKVDFSAFLCGLYFRPLHRTCVCLWLCCLPDVRGMTFVYENYTCQFLDFNMQTELLRKLLACERVAVVLHFACVCAFHELLHVLVVGEWQMWVKMSLVFEQTCDILRKSSVVLVLITASFYELLHDVLAKVDDVVANYDDFRLILGGFGQDEVAEGLGNCADETVCERIC